MYYYVVFSVLRPPLGSAKLISTNLTNLVALEQSHQKPVGVLLHRHKVCELGGDKLQRPPVVALRNW